MEKVRKCKKKGGKVRNKEMNFACGTHLYHSPRGGEINPKYVKRGKINQTYVRIYFPTKMAFSENILRLTKKKKENPEIQCTCTPYFGRELSKGLYLYL